MDEDFDDLLAMQDDYLQQFDDFEPNYDDIMNENEMENVPNKGNLCLD